MGDRVSWRRTEYWPPCCGAVPASRLSPPASAVLLPGLAAGRASWRREGIGQLEERPAPGSGGEEHLACRVAPRASVVRAGCALATMADGESGR